jgi:hypothetical protein
VVDLKTREARPYAGSGRENHVDGSLEESALAQPSGLATDGKSIFFADSEISSIRAASLPPGRTVSTIVGQGLFDFGDIDGVGDKVRLQHPLGVAYLNGKLYVADTYNHKIKEIEIQKRESRTYAGTRQVGANDGDRKQAQFNEPGGISATSRELFVADTNNHLIRRIEVATGRVSTVKLSGLEKLAGASGRRFRGRVVEMAPLALAPGAANVTVSFNLPKGYKYNQGAPFFVSTRSGNDQLIRLKGEQGGRNFTESPFPLTIPLEVAAATPGSARPNLTVDAVLYFCNDAEEQVCLVDSIRVEVPIEARTGAPATGRIEVAAKARGISGSEGGPVSGSLPTPPLGPPK